MVIQLSDLLRRLLSAGEREFCRLSDEVHFVRLYLQLQQNRFADRLQLSLPVAAQMPAAWVPSLILQPLVENAVIHGLANHTGTVAIRLEVSVLDDTLLLQVTNTMALDHSPTHEGIGLRNVRERLAVHFGERSELQATVTDTEEWSAWIRMPFLSDVPKSITELS
jgi:LytS/YehU family sensor histidine kinase